MFFFPVNFENLRDGHICVLHAIFRDYLKSYDVLFLTLTCDQINIINTTFNTVLSDNLHNELLLKNS